MRVRSCACVRRRRKWTKANESEVRAHGAPGEWVGSAECSKEQRFAVANLTCRGSGMQTELSSGTATPLLRAIAHLAPHLRPPGQGGRWARATLRAVAVVGESDKVQQDMCAGVRRCVHTCSSVRACRWRGVRENAEAAKGPRRSRAAAIVASWSGTAQRNRSHSSCLRNETTKEVGDSRFQSVWRRGERSQADPYHLHTHGD